MILTLIILIQSNDPMCFSGLWLQLQGRSKPWLILHGKETRISMNLSSKPPCFTTIVCRLLYERSKNQICEFFGIGVCLSFMKGRETRQSKR